MLSTEILESWVIEAVDLMVTRRISLLQAASLLDKDLSPQEAAAIQRRRSFRDLHQQASRVYFASKGGVADTDKTVLVGSILDDAQWLRAMNKPKEAAEVVVQAAKMLGYVGAETNFNLFAELSGSDLQRAIEEIRQRRAVHPATKPN